MSDDARGPEDSGAQIKARQRRIWAAGDYLQMVRTIDRFGPTLIEACRIGPGMRVLDVAAGAGNAAIAAARKGADVVASDLTPELIELGRQATDAAGLSIEWLEADAEALPFPANDFDVVTSSVGAMFAPDHARVASELVRVCRPGGTIGMINWTPEGWVGQLFGLVGRHAPPPPPDVQPPLRWGEEGHVREMFGDGVTEVHMSRHQNRLDMFATPEELADFYIAHFGPVALLRSRWDADQDAAFRAELLDFARRSDLGDGGKSRWELEYLLVIARAA